MQERPGSIVVTLTRVAPRLMDDDNLAGALKACRDQVATHLRVDDRDSCVRWVVEQRKGGVREYAVEVRIEPRSATCPACGSVVGAVPAGGAT
mgnify:FL=1